MSYYSNKSIPTTKNIATLLSLTANGSTSTVTAAGAAVTDLQSLEDGNYNEGVLFIEAKTVNGQGVTPTSPGASKTYTLFYAFCEDVIELADAPTVLDGVAQSLDLELPNSASSASAGTKYHQVSEEFLCKGRYLYTWYDRDDFASANSKVNVTISLKRL